MLHRSILSQYCKNKMFPQAFLINKVLRLGTYNLAFCKKCCEVLHIFSLYSILLIIEFTHDKLFKINPNIEGLQEILQLKSRHTNGN